MFPPVLRLLPMLLPLGLLTAQRTWIVDRAGGPGVDFLDLPAALATAAAGDTVRVHAHPTPYTPGIATRGIALMADPLHGSGGFVRIAAGMVVRAVPANEAFVMRAFHCENTGAPAILIDACPGRVVIEAVNVSGSTNHAAIVVQQAAAVAIQNCSLIGPPAVAVTGSRVAIVACFLAGRAGTVASPPMPACTIRGSVVDISEGTWQGGGVPSSPPVASAPALVVDQGSTVTATGGVLATFLTAGVSAVPSPGIHVQLSTLALDPAVITGGVTGSSVVVRRVPCLRLTSFGRGVPLLAHVRAPVGDLVVLALGFPGVPVPVSPFGDLWLDPSAILMTMIAVQQSEVSGAVPLSLPLNTPSGLQLGLQALVGSGSTFRFSNPVVAVVP